MASSENDTVVTLKAIDERIAAIKKVLSQFEPKPATEPGTPDRPVESERGRHTSEHQSKPQAY